MQALTWREFIALGNRHNWPDGSESDIGKLLETIVFLTDPGKHNIAVSREYMREIRALLEMPKDAVTASGGEVAITQDWRQHNQPCQCGSCVAQYAAYIASDPDLDE